MPRMTAIQEVSALLRRMAQNAGAVIDDTYRNVNGISFQMHSMESAFCGKTILKPATNLFREVAAMSEREFHELLTEAYFLIYSGKDDSKAGGSIEMAKKVVTEEMLRETLSKIAPYGSLGVSASEISTSLQVPLYKIKYLLNSANWVKYDGKYYSMAQDFSSNKVPSAMKAAIKATDASCQKLEQLMKRVAGPKTNGVTLSYLAFALKKPGEEILELIQQVDWIEKCGDAYRLTEGEESTGSSNNKNSSEQQAVKKTPSGKNSQLMSRLEHVMKSFASPSSSGVSKEFLSFSLNCPYDNIAPLIDQLDWIESFNGFYRMRDTSLEGNTAATPNTIQLGSASTNIPVPVSEVPQDKIPPQEKPEEKANAMVSKVKAEIPAPKASSQISGEKKSLFDGVSFSDYLQTSEDNELFSKYPVLIKRVYAAMKNFDSPSSAVRIYDATKRISRIEAVTEILDRASWSRKEGDLYRFVTKDIPAPLQDTPVSVQDKSTDSPASATSTIDFESIGNLAFTVPVSYQYFDIFKAGFTSWKGLYSDFLGCYYEDYPHLLYHGVNFSAKENARPDIADKDHKDTLIAPREIPGASLYVETNFDVSDIVRRIKRLLDKANIDYENLTITYSCKNNLPEAAVQAKNTPQEVQVPTVSALPALDEVHDEKAEFMQWLRSTGTIEVNVKNFATAVELAERYAKELGCRHVHFFTADQTETKLAYNEIFANSKFVKFNQTKSNIFSRAIRKYMEFQRNRPQNDNPRQKKLPADEPSAVIEQSPETQLPKPVDEIHTLLFEEYPNGFRLNSSLEAKKFKKKYEAKYGTAPSMTDEQIIWAIQKCGIVHDNRVYLPEKMLDDDTKRRLEVYIKDSFQSGKKCLFYEALFSVFSEQFLDHNIYNADMLKVYLQSVYRGKFYFFNNYFSTDRNATSDPAEEIRNCMVEHGKPIAYDELFKLLPHIPDDKIRFTLNTTKEFISNGRKQYFHINVFQISDDELNDIAGIIQLLIQQNKYISGNELIAAIRAKLPYVLEANAEIADIGVRNALAQLLDSKFSFKGNIISALGVEIEMRDVFSEFSKNTPSFTIDELSKMASDLNTTIYFDYVYKNAVRISQDNFVRKEMVSFDTQQIDQVLDTFCPGRYISVQDITNFVAFPDCGYSWNSFLLESYVAMHSKRYFLLHNTFGVKSVSGGIVKRSSGINSMDMLVTLVLADSNCQLKKEAALEYLYDYGYLGMKRYSTIEQVLIDAQTIRNKRGM